MGKLLSFILIGSIGAAVILGFVGMALNSCSQPAVVKADTGEIIQEGNQLKAKMYDPEGEGNTFDVIELKRGGVTYLVFLRSQTGLQVVNYTLDSLEVAFHKEHIDKPDSSQNIIFDHVRANQNY